MVGILDFRPTVSIIDLHENDSCIGVGVLEVRCSRRLPFARNTLRQEVMQGGHGPLVHTVPTLTCPTYILLVCSKAVFKEDGKLNFITVKRKKRTFKEHLSRPLISKAFT